MVDWHAGCTSRLHSPIFLASKTVTGRCVYFLVQLAEVLESWQVQHFDRTPWLTFRVFVVVDSGGGGSDGGVGVLAVVAVFAVVSLVFLLCCCGCGVLFMVVLMLRLLPCCCYVRHCCLLCCCFFTLAHCCDLPLRHGIHSGTMAPCFSRYRCLEVMLTLPGLEMERTPCFSYHVSQLDHGLILDYDRVTVRLFGRNTYD